MIQEDMVYTDVEGIENEIMERQRHKLYVQKFAQLSEVCRKVLQLYFEGMPMSEIGEQFGYTLLYTRKQKYKCKNRLLALIKQDPSFNELKENGN